MKGIRAEVRIDSPPECLVAAASQATGTESTSVSWTGSTEEDGEVVEEFLLESWTGDQPPEIDGPTEDLEVSFRYDSMTAMRFHRSVDRTCPCEFIEQFGSPVREVFARDGSLVVVFHVPSIERLQDILAGLKETWSDISVDRLLRSDGARDVKKMVLVDRGELTERQREVLLTAHEMGYFDYPKRANAGEVADALDINPTTFSEHLSAAQRKLFDAIVSDKA